MGLIDEVFFAPWQLKISQNELISTLQEMGKNFLSDGLLMPCTIFYIFVLPMSRWYFDNGEHYRANTKRWKQSMAVYNYLMCFYSVVTFVLSSYVLWHTQLFTNDCNILFRNRMFVILTKGFYYSKFVEYLDTFFLYVKNSPVSYLHWIHHIGASVNLWFLIVYEGEPGWVFVWLNSFIHTMMYWYFATTLYARCDCFKPFITISQIAQFLTGFAFLWIYPRKVPCFRQDKYRMIGIYYYTWFYVGIVLLLFLNFFVRTYLQKKPDKRQNGPANLADKGSDPAIPGSAEGSEKSKDQVKGTSKPSKPTKGE